MVRLVARRYGVAGPRDPLERELYAWAAEGDGRAFGGLDLLEG